MQKNLMILLAIIVFSCSVIMGYQVCSLSAAPVKFKLASTLSGIDHPHMMNARRFAALIKERSGGDIQIDIIENYGGDRDIIESTQLGMMDMGIISAQTLTSFAKSASALNLPWLFDNQDFMFDEILSGPVGREILNAIDKESRMKILAVTYYDVRHLVLSTRPVYTVNDLKGLKLRTLEDPAEIAMWKEVGASPTPIPFPELYTAMQTKVVDGFVGNFSVNVSHKFYEVSKYISLTDHYNSLNLFVMNQAKFDQLKPDQQQLLLKVAVDATKEMKSEILKKRVGWRKTCEDAGVKVNEIPPNEIENLRAIASNAFKGYINHPPVKKFVDQVNQLWAQNKNKYR